MQRIARDNATVMLIVDRASIHSIVHGGIKAIKGIDFYVNEGELVTLINANGAGQIQYAACAVRAHPAGGRGKVT